MIRKIFRESLLAGLLIILLVACGGAPAGPQIDSTQGAQILAGTYTTSISAENVSNFSLSKDPALAGNIGDWQFTLMPDGKFTAELGGNFMAEGNYTVKDDRIEVYINTSCEDCGCDGSIGRYVWALSGDALSFARRAGSCYGMDLVLTSQPLTRVP